ncbi:MAG: hypothetical protein JWQ06_1834 [Mucilaginibacter sp.]|nr:hypothetical protein [Mucilaginibacter sp.]
MEKAFASTLPSYKIRNITLDIIRVFAAFGVILIHVPANTYASLIPSILFHPICVPFFFITSLTYFFLSLKRKTFTIKMVANKTWFRILIPYFAWTAIYILCFVIKSALMQTHHTFSLLQDVFYGGSAIQLYFITDLIVMQAISLSFFILFSKNVLNIWIGILLLIFSICYLEIGSINNFFGVTNPITISIYLISAYYLAKIKSSVVNFSYIIIGDVLISIIFYCSLNYPDFENAYSTYTSPLGGIGLFLIALGIPTKITMAKWMYNLSTTSFGIYLSHFLFLEAFEAILKKVHLNIYYDLTNRLLITVMIFIISIIFTLLLKKTGYGKMIFLGESNINSNIVTSLP